MNKYLNLKKINLSTSTQTKWTKTRTKSIPHFPRLQHKFTSEPLKVAVYPRIDTKFHTVCLEGSLTKNK